MPLSRPVIALAAVMLTALPTWYALHQTPSLAHPAVKTTAHLEPPACAADRQVPGGACLCQGETNWSGSNCIPVPPLLRRRVGTMVLGTDLHADNCVYFARDRVRTLPFGLSSWKGKLAIINAHEARAGDVAMIEIPTGVYREVGHVALVESVTDNSITILEGNYYAGQVSRRTATGNDVQDAARMLGIAGYFRP